MNRPKIVLASSSPHRRALLQRLGLEFTCVAPKIDECSLEGEHPRSTVARLSEEKARSVATTASEALVIGSDQLALMDGRPLGKPGSRDANIAQLEAASGRWVDFLTGVCLLNSSSDFRQLDVVEYSVEFRRLSRSQIESYVDRERPLDCAGGFKAEGLGIALFRRMRGDDPTALIGLPLIRLSRMLEKEGVEVLSPEPVAESDRS
ncbi:MAG TPA: Maf family protein [Gammaproteobacteria bacterium]|nr:Maf family protein [Gammaproteobacteria bacterium]